MAVGAATDALLPCSHSHARTSRGGRTASAPLLLPCPVAYDPACACLELPTGPFPPRRSGLPARQTATLDAFDGAGWELAAALLRPRQVVTDNEGGVKFVNTGKAPRLTAAQALKSPFIRAAGSARTSAVATEDEEGSGSRGAARASSRGGSGSNGRAASRSGSAERAAAAAPKAKAKRSGGGGVMSMWGNLKGRLFDLEARVLKEATATEVQTSVVRQLRDDVAAGRASETKLAREQAALADMQRSLASSVKDLGSVYGAARGFLSGILGGGGSGGKAAAAGSGASSRGQQAVAAAPAAAADQRMPKWAAKEVSLERVDPDAYWAQQRDRSSGSSSSSSRGSWQQEDKGAEAVESVAAAEAAGAAAAAAVGGAARSAWRLGSSALSGLGAFAASLREEAQRNAAAAAAEAALQKRAAAAYLEALQALAGPTLSAASRWEETASRLEETPAFAVLSDARREQVGHSQGRGRIWSVWL